MSIPKIINRLIGKAMHNYQMLDDGDRVMVAVSGGLDSLVLSAVLKEWQKKAPIRYQLIGVHLDMGFPEGSVASATERQLQKLGVDFVIEKTTFGPDALAEKSGKSGCFYCARNRRTRLFNLAREKECNKLALGHHKEDIIETFFLNLFYSGNLSTMVPRQPLFNGNLNVIRPLAYLNKEQVKSLAHLFGITAAENPCPLAGRSKREKIRTILQELYGKDAQLESNIFAALSNVRKDYLL
ncbi:MAG: ATP-binding protein [Pseudomonadota bacterium]